MLNAVIPEGTAPADGIALGVDGDAQAANPASTTNDAQARLKTFDMLDLLLIDISDLTTVDRSHPIRDFTFESHDWKRRVANREKVADPLLRGCSLLHTSQTCLRYERDPVAGRARRFITLDRSRLAVGGWSRRRGGSGTETARREAQMDAVDASMQTPPTASQSSSNVGCCQQR